MRVLCGRKTRTWVLTKSEVILDGQRPSRTSRKPNGFVYVALSLIRCDQTPFQEPWVFKFSVQSLNSSLHSCFSFYWLVFIFLQFTCSIQGNFKMETDSCNFQWRRSPWSQATTAFATSRCTENSESRSWKSADISKCVPYSSIADVIVSTRGWLWAPFWWSTLPGFIGRTAGPMAKNSRSTRIRHRQSWWEFHSSQWVAEKTSCCVSLAMQFRRQ